MRAHVDWLNALGLTVFASLPSSVSIALQIMIVTIAVAFGKAIGEYWNLRQARWFQERQQLEKDDPPKGGPGGGALALLLALVFGPLAACGGRFVLVRFDLPEYGPCVGQAYEHSFDGGTGYRVGSFQCAGGFGLHSAGESDASAD